MPDRCDLCPRLCGANRFEGRRGYCGADDTLVVSRAALHVWEEPLISADAGSGAVFFAHCPLRCIYCQNAGIAHRGQGKSISIDRLAQIFTELQDQGAANINLVTPTQYAPLVVVALRIARSRGLTLPVVYNTSGYERPEVILDLVDDVDIYLTDFKYASGDEGPAKLYSNAPDYFSVASSALDAMIQTAGEPRLREDGQALAGGVIVRHLLLPGRLDDSKWVMRYLWERYGDSIMYSVMSQYTPVATFPNAPELNEPTTPEEYERLLDFMDSIGMDDYFWQDGPAAKESFIPAFDLTGV